jgi:hypothetical protein
MRSVLITALSAIVAALPAAEANLLVNPSFDNGFVALAEQAKAADGALKITGQIGDGWLDNSDWADVKVFYARSTDSPHGGQGAQAIVAGTIASGAVQFAQKVDFRKGHTYDLSVWMRGTVDAPVEIVFRQRGEPYATLGSTVVTTTAKWARQSLRVKMTDDAQGFVMFRLTKAGEVLLDDAVLADVTN